MTTADKNTSEPNADEIRYTQAMEELESLLDEIDNDGVDLDELALKVERASKLITVCRDKIENTEMQVKAIIDGLESTQGDDG
ncbi:exodeoxyribonuclease VII small subunit [Persicimonas caeni]|uniref:Exodeoxyribonuclease VII small subunit n=1 Tax=Persicimonas caeni TaxID=2292766 RepID=A0A4Y6PNP7_PERCE|nr:exodeoxyribonuclease VII small subunit [Persicimonas caeni]QDG49819.1 exodeoxyribonuclease VII small subunit [Persicimonas caeni]QED31040.1 exodeoxyribonuclease VII small subunit [Persicimonas caeni]